MSINLGSRIKIQRYFAAYEQIKNPPQENILTDLDFHFMIFLQEMHSIQIIL